jgi:hypothetical protein
LSTKGIISRALPRCPGWSRSSGNKSLLKLLEQGIDELFEFDHDCMIYRGSDNNGLPPFLITVAGNYDYSIVAASLSCGDITRSIGGVAFNLTARKVKGVFIETINSLPQYTQYRNPSERPCFDTGISEIVVSSQPAYDTTAPAIKFQFDPGSYSDRYYVEFYVGAPRLTSEAIQIPMPATFEKYLEEYMVMCANEKVIDAINFMEDFMKPRFHVSMGTAANTNVTRTPPNYV